MTNTGWSEDDSERFIDYGRYFVPERERQLSTIASLIPAGEGPFAVLELSCGEGLLAEAILSRYPGASVVGLDRSPAMLAKAAERLAGFGSRFIGQEFDMAASDWRSSERRYRAVVSSLAVHHLRGPEKQRMFADLLPMLERGGALIIADVVEASTALAADLAATAWDEAVQRRALELDGDLRGFTLFQQLRWNMYRYNDPDDYDHPSRLADQLRWLAEAGYADVDVYWMLAGHAIYGGRRPV
jgi:tRNA (cmo5U34)-methyltransferase